LINEAASDRCSPRLLFIKDSELNIDERDA
jgi:hypothetical protein